MYERINIRQTCFG